ncbi:MAG: hypothetical protein ACYSU1_02750, partial [Planctomycetota bacterium]
MLIPYLILLPTFGSLSTPAPSSLVLRVGPQDLQQEPSTAEVLQAWESGDLDGDSLHLSYAHLRGRVDGEGAMQLARMLSDPEVANRSLLMSLLLQVPLDQSRSVLQDLLRDETRSAEERGRVAEFLLLLDGAVAYQALEETVRADAEPPY